MEEKLYIIAHQFKICRHDRELRNGHKPACLWFTGLSGSGKSTLANATEQELYKLNANTYTLDGDDIRRGLNSDLNFTEEGRAENMRRIGEVAKLMCDAGLIVLAAFVSPFRREREMLRGLMGGGFVEIFVDAPLDVCEERDIKGLYKKARNGEISNFTGISSPFEAPGNPDIHVRTDLLPVEKSVEVIIGKVLPRIKL